MLNLVWTFLHDYLVFSLEADIMHVFHNILEKYVNILNKWVILTKICEIENIHK